MCIHAGWWVDDSRIHIRGTVRGCYVRVDATIGRGHVYGGWTERPWDGDYTHTGRRVGDDSCVNRSVVERRCPYNDGIGVVTRRRWLRTGVVFGDDDRTCTLTSGTTVVGLLCKIDRRR